MQYTMNCLYKDGRVRVFIDTNDIWFVLNDIFELLGDDKYNKVVNVLDNNDLSQISGGGQDYEGFLAVNLHGFSEIIRHCNFPMMATGFYDWFISGCKS